MVWQPYLKLLSQRPRAIKYSGVYDQLPEEWQRYLKACTEVEQKAAFSLLADLMTTTSFEDVTEALRIANALGHPTPQQIKQAFRAKNFNHQPYESFETKTTVPSLPEITRGTDRYNVFSLSRRCLYE